MEFTPSVAESSHTCHALQKVASTLATERLPVVKTESTVSLVKKILYLHAFNILKCAMMIYYEAFDFIAGNLQVVAVYFQNGI